MPQHSIQPGERPGPDDEGNTVGDTGGGMTRLRKTRTSATSIPWSTAQDARLSFRARGVLTYLLSKPPGWKVDAARIAKDGAEGRDAVEKALRELRQAGYYRVIRYRRDGVDASGVTRRGMFATEGWIADMPEQEWADEYAQSNGRAVTLQGYDPEADDTEAPTPENPGSEASPNPGSPIPGSPTPENPGSKSRRESKTQEREFSVEGSLRSPSTARPAETQQPLIDTPPPPKTNMQIAEATAARWVQIRRDAGFPVPNSKQVHMGVRGYVKAALDAGVDLHHIREALNKCDEDLPPMPTWRRALNQVVTGRTQQRATPGVYTEPNADGPTAAEVFGS